MREELKTVKIGLLGFGVVGQGVWKNIDQNRLALEARLGVVLEIAKVVVRDIKRERSVSVPENLITSEANELLEDDSCLLYTSPSPRDISGSRMPSSA